MALKITKVDVWAGNIQDTPGGLASVLDPLAAAGANLDCVIARRQAEKPGTGVVFVCPVKGKALKAAQGAGLSQAAHIATLRIDGPNKGGVGKKIMQAIGDAGVNVRGVSAVVIGSKFAAYIGFDSATDASKAAKAIKAIR